MRQSPEQVRFNTGEVDPSMRREGMDGAAQRMENWVPTVQGAMIRRPGTLYGELKLDPAPEPPPAPIPPGFVIPPADYVTDGEFHGYSVRRLMNDDYVGPLLQVGRDPTVPGNDNRIDLFAVNEPDGNGIRWLDESRILQAFVDTGQIPANGQGRLSVYKVYDQVSPGVTPRDIEATATNMRCGFAFTGDFSSFAYVGVPANETSVRKARCFVGPRTPWSFGNLAFFENKSNLRYVQTDWAPSGGDLANGGFLAIMPYSEPRILNTSSDDFFKFRAYNFTWATSDTFATFNTRINEDADNETDAYFPPRVETPQGPNPGGPNSNGYWATSDEVIFAYAYKFDVSNSNPAFGYCFSTGENGAELDHGTTNASFGAPTLGESLSSAGFTMDNLDLSVTSITAGPDGCYWHFYEFWWLWGDTGPWGANAMIDFPERLEELNKTVAINPSNAELIP